MSKPIESLYRIVFNKQFIIISCALFLFIVFHKPIEDFISGVIVKKILSLVESKWYNDLVFLTIIIGSVLYVLNNFKKYTPSKPLLICFAILVFIYLSYRSFGDQWNFIPFYFFPSIAYTDSIIVILLSNFLLLIPKQIQKQNLEGASFFSDDPIVESKNDELGYNAYSEILADKIKKSTFGKSFAIGINGKWGSGKSSFIELIKASLKSGENIIHINFDPWNSSNPKAIIQDFFETVQEQIGPYHSSLSRLLISYSQKLVALNDNTVSQTIQASVSAITGFESLNKLFEEINTALRKINRKIIVYIDDLDRLDKEEVIEVIRLIRNTANFYNCFFIVAYDKNYILNALKQQNSYNHEQFLDKIFQIEISLPHFKKDIFRYKLAEKLKLIFPEHYHKTIEEETIGTSTLTPTYLNDWLDNIRDVTRLANSLSLNLNVEKLLGEVDFNDFLRLEILRLKYPSVYELLFKRKDEFLESFSKPDGTNRYRLKTLDRPEGNDTEAKLYKNHLEFYLSKYYPFHSVPQNEIKNVVDLVVGIFRGDDSFFTESRSHLSVIYPNKFDRYFAYKLFSDSLSEVEFIEALKLPQDELNLKITDWVKNNLEFELQKRFTLINSFQTKEEFEKIITAIFHYANQKSLHPGYFTRDKVGYDGKDLIDKLSNYNDKLTNLYSGNNKELRSFIISLFNKAGIPYSFEADFIRQINKEIFDEETNKFPLSKEELKSQSVNYFKKYCSAVENFDWNIWRLLHDSKQVNWIPQGYGSYNSQEIYPEESIAILKDFITKKDLNGFLYAIIGVEPFDQQLFSIGSDTTQKIFGSWIEFKNFIYKQDEEKWSYLKEFKRFFTLFEEGGFSKYVAFEFKDIPIEGKLNK